MPRGGAVARRVAVVLAGGDSVAAHHLDLPDDAFVVAADSGIDLAEELGLGVDVVVGDLDSASPEAVEKAIAAGTRVSRHPSAKDATDLELALVEAVAQGCDEAVVLGITGGRLDHFIANVLLLAAAAFDDVRIGAVSDEGTVTVIRDEEELFGAPGSTVTLLAVGGPALGVETSGLEYPLAGERLDAGSSRGVSNVMMGEACDVRVSAGTLLAIQPREVST